MRCDVNISLRPAGSKMLGTRTEIKNMNSMSFMERAIAYEYERQAEILDGGGEIVQATLRYDEHTGETSVMRTKEDAQDYRYFPEPDILTVTIPQRVVDETAAALPELPLEKLRRYIDVLGVSEQNARLIYKYKRVCDFFERALFEGAGARRAANLIVGTVYSSLATEEDKEKFDVRISAEEFGKLVKLLDDGKINATLAQMTLAKMLESGKGVDEFISAEDKAGVSDDQLKELCARAIAANPQAVADFKGGKEKAISALYGFIKRATQGKADIKKADALLKEMLK